MDLGTVVGLVLILSLLVTAMLLGPGLGPYLDLTSFIIVVLGAFSALFVAFKVDQVKSFGAFFKIAIQPPTYDIAAIIKTLVDYATQARRDGILSLEGALANETNLFMKKGLSMAVDGNEPDVIREMLEIEVEQTSARHQKNAALFSTFGGFAGSYGMIGTLIGLIAMLVNMSDPASIGPAMAVALITTMYGAIIGASLGDPISNILNIRNDDETLVNSIVVEGIMSIQAGDNPRVLEGKLLSFLEPSKRVSQF